MFNSQRDLELLLMGAILANPELKDQIDGFSDRELGGVIESLKGGKIHPLLSWLKVRRVVPSSGRGEALKAIRKQQSIEWLRDQMLKANTRLHTATKLNLTETIEKETKRLSDLSLKLKALTEQQHKKRILKAPSGAKS